MAKIKLQGHADGSGIITLTAPNTSTDRVISLPDATGTLLNSDGSAASLTAIPAAQITGTLPAISGASLTGVATGRKNLIINGNMNVWQRATSFALTNGKAYTADRIAMNPQSVASTHSRQAVTSPLAGMPQYCLRVQRNVNVTATGLIYISYDGESSMAYPCRGKKLTLSFYARKGANYSATNDYFTLGIVGGKGTDQSLVNGYTSGGYLANQNNVLTTSWQRFTVTTGTVADDISQIGLQGTRNGSGTAGANDYYEITGIQVEISDVATDLEHRGYGEELALCQRYFTAFNPDGFGGNGTVGIGGYMSTSRVDVAFYYPTTMRVNPTVTASSGTNYWYAYRAGVIDYFDSWAGAAGAGINAMALYVTSGISGTSGWVAQITANNAAANITLDAEL